METLIINTFGNDTIGIASKISGIVTSLNGNIDKSKMIRLESIFSIIMVISIPSENKELLSKKLNEVQSLDTMIRPITINNKKLNITKYSFKLQCLDNEGIIFHYTDLFNKQKINIDKMDTFTNNAPISGSLLFNMESIISIPQKLDIYLLKKSLKLLSSKYNTQFNLLPFKSK